jgi:hypothetical protein
VAVRPPVGSFTMTGPVKRALIGVVVLVVLAVLWVQFVGVYVDWLWFGEVGFREVFTTRAVSLSNPGFGGGSVIPRAPATRG